MKLKHDVWLVIGETIGSDEDSKHIIGVFDDMDAKENAENLAKHMELTDSALRCFVRMHTIEYDFK